MSQPDTAVGQRLLQLAREALPGEKVEAAFTGMVRPTPLVLTLAPALIVVVLYVAIAVVLQPGPVASVLIVVAGLVLVLVAFMRVAVQSVLIVATRKELVAVEYRLGRTGVVLDRQPRPLVVEQHWDPRYRRVRVGEVPAYVVNRMYGELLDELAA